MSRIWIISLLSAVLPLASTLRAERQAITSITQAEVNVQDTMRQDSVAALNQLKSAQTLESAHIGFAGILSSNLLALREVIEHDKAVSLLEELYQNGSLTAKLYAIIGFQLLQKTELAQTFIDDASQYQSTEIEAMEGCVIYKTTVGDALKMIRDGYYVEQFQSAD